MQEHDPARTPQDPGGGPSDPAPVLRTDLRQNSLGLVGVTMQAITHIAPAIAALFFTQFIVSLAGITAPLAYVVGIHRGADARQHPDPVLQAPAVGRRATTPTSAAR